MDNLWSSIQTQCHSPWPKLSKAFVLRVWIEPFWSTPLNSHEEVLLQISEYFWTNRTQSTYSIMSSTLVLNWFDGGRWTLSLETFFLHFISEFIRFQFTVNEFTCQANRVYPFLRTFYLCFVAFDAKRNNYSWQFHVLKQIKTNHLTRWVRGIEREMNLNSINMFSFLFSISFSYWIFCFV